MSQRRKLSYGNMKCFHVSYIVDPEPKCFLISNPVQGKNKHTKSKKQTKKNFCFFFFSSKSLGRDSFIISFTKGLFDLPRPHN